MAHPVHALMGQVWGYQFQEAQLGFHKLPSQGHPSNICNAAILTLTAFHWRSKRNCSAMKRSMSSLCVSVAFCTAWGSRLRSASSDHVHQALSLVSSCRADTGPQVWASAQCCCLPSVHQRWSSVASRDTQLMLLWPAHSCRPAVGLLRSWRPSPILCVSFYFAAEQLQGPL